MNFLLFCCLFGTFLATGMCLECEFCWELGQQCTGRRSTCKDYEDTCVTLQSEVMIAALSITFTAKHCGVSDTCDRNYLESSLHNEIRVRSKRTCCTGSECQTLPSPVLESQVNQANQPNGLQCPACIGITSVECNEHLVSCRASENQCLYLSGKSLDFLREMSFKGCASESLCTLLGKKSWTFYEELEMEVKCSPALPQSSQ